jgi:hypothetical protein
VIVSPNLHTFIHDAKRFALYNRSVIEQAPLQLYYSALVFAPGNSIVRKKFKGCIPDWIQLKPKVQAHWNTALQTLEGHTNSVQVSSLLTRRQAGRVWIGRSDSTALGRRHGSSAPDARVPYRLGPVSGLLT